jgi:gliding motility-associated-like protein
MLQAQGDVVVTVESVTDVTCGGGSDGSISVSVTGGIGKYTYLLLRSTFPAEYSDSVEVTSWTFTNHIKFTNYLVIVSDADPVTADGYAWATIGGPNPIDITSNIATDITCNPLNDGTITVTASGEDGNYIFELAGPDPQSNTTGIFTGLTDGVHQVTVRHDGVCPSTDMTPPMTIDRPTPVSIGGISTVDVLCYGDNTGSIGITPGGGTPGGGGTGYTYDWTGPSGFTSTAEDISNLEAGDYFVTVYDGNMCSANAGPITLTQPTELTASLSGTTDVTCNGGNDGTATMVPGGGAGGYSFNWDGQLSGFVSADQNPTNLVADTYDFTLFDASGCSKTFTDFATINEPDPITVTVVSTTDVNCPGGSDGSADITPAGGNGSYTYLWSGATSGYSSTNQNPTGMPADVYSLTITDGLGCNQSFPDLLTIGQPDPVAVSVISTGEVSCFNGSDGSATITVTGGTPVYLFSWTGDVTGHTSANQNPVDLVADTYDLDITDANGCPQSFNDLVTISQPDDISVTVDNITHVNCNGEATGAIEISPAGGTPLYSFAWSGPNGYTASTQNISNLEAGDYSLTITDAHGCVKDFINVATVSTTTSIISTFDLTHVNCNGASDGAIDATVSGGTPNYIYAWTGPSGFTASTEDISGLAPGSYRLTVTDDLGCVEVFPDQVITEPTPITASVTVYDIDCYGAGDGAVDLQPAGGVPPYLFAWTGPSGFTASTEDISALEAGAYSVTITDDNGCSILFTDIATVTESPEIQLSSVKSDISCGGLTDGSIDITVTGGVPPYTFSWTGPGSFTSSSEDLSGLAAGTYDLDITDGNGCLVNFPGVETIVEPTPITATYVSQVDVLCNGDATGSIEIDVSGGTAPLSFQWTHESGPVASSDEDPTGLLAGSYSLSITDVNNCSASYPDMATITEPPPLTSSLAKTDITCYGDKNGTITVTAAGGTGPYEYSRIADLDIFYQPSNVFTGLGPNLFTVWTRDANHCVVSETIQITEPEEIQIITEIKSGQNLCYGDSSAQIDIQEVTGGVQPYEYSINGGVDFYPTSVFPNLPAGNYQTVVRDASGCEASGNLNVITQPSMLQIDTYTQEDISSCSDALEGRIVIAGTGGNGQITYILNDTLVNPAGDFQYLPAGAHKITLQDENGCTRDTNVVILSPPPIVVDLLTVNDVSGCFGDSNGSISISGSGGMGSISYALNGGAYQPGGTFSGLLAGDHTITLKDDNDCTLDTVVTVGEPGPILITGELVTQITCAGAADGIIEIQAAGGTAPLSYTLNPGAVSNGTGIFSPLAPGTYIVSVDDASGCGPVDSSPLTVSDPPVLVLDSAVATNISCNGADNGSIRFYASGGVPPYEYSIDNQASWSVDSVFTSLAPGTYETSIRDVNFCPVYGGTIVMSDPPALSLSIVTSDVTTCAGDSTGSLAATGSGGTGLLEYSLDGVDYQPVGFWNLPGGTYTVYLRDSAGCTYSEMASINEPAPVTAVIDKTDATFGNLGSITFTSTGGGTPPYTYTIGGPTGTFTTETQYDSLEAGTYHAMVMDDHGCTYEEMVEILDVLPLDVVVNVVHVSCFGADDGSIEMIPQDAEGSVEYSIDSGASFVQEPLFENLPGNTTYYIAARDSAGKVFTDSVTIIEPPEIIVSRNITPAECNAFSETGGIEVTASGGAGGFSYLWSDGSTEEDRSGILAGTYILVTTDANNCTRVDTMVVSSLIFVDAYAGEDTTICNGSSIQLDGQGGHIPSWSPADFLTDPDIANPVAVQVTQSTTYVLTITEEASPYGCYNTDTITISVTPLTGLEVTPDTFIVRGASLQLEAIGGPFSAYRWEPETGLDDSSIPNPVASPLESTRYTVYATNEYDCEESDSVYVEVIEDIRAYNVFTPNGDEINDFFDIRNAHRFPEMLVEVYSRWGDLLFSTVGYDDASRWDGTAHGKEVPMGTYYYIIIPYKGATPITGNVTIIR